MRISHITCILCLFSAILLASHETAAKENTHTVAKVEKKKHTTKRSTKTRRAHRKQHQTYATAPKEFVPLSSLSERQITAIEAYNTCMNNESEDSIRAAMTLAYEYKDEESMKGTPEKLGRESCVADTFKLARYETLQDIEKAKRQAELVLVRSPLIDIPNVPLERHYARIWVRDYLLSLAHDMQTVFRGGKSELSLTPIMRVPSLVRSFKDQDRLVQTGKSPANCTYRAICSTHTTGSTIDISSRRLRVSEYIWLRDRLIEDRKNGKILVIRESWGGHFHVFVIPPNLVAWYKSGKTSDESAL